LCPDKTISLDVGHKPHDGFCHDKHGVGIEHGKEGKVDERFCSNFEVDDLKGAPGAGDEKDSNAFFAKSWAANKNRGRRHRQQSLKRTALNGGVVIVGKVETEESI